MFTANGTRQIQFDDYWKQIDAYLLLLNNYCYAVVFYIVPKKPDEFFTVLKLIWDLKIWGNEQIKTVQTDYYGETGVKLLFFSQRDNEQ